MRAKNDSSCVGHDIYANLVRSAELRATAAPGGYEEKARAALEGMRELVERSLPLGKVDVALAACDVGAMIIQKSSCVCVMAWRIQISLCEQGIFPVTYYDVFKKWTLRALDDSGGPEFGIVWQPRVLDVAAAAKRLDCSPQYVRRLAREKRIVARRSPAGSWICDATSVNEYRRKR